MGFTYQKNEYAIPRGRVFFDRFDANGNKTGEQAFGNCPGFTFTADTTKAEHYSSEKGLREKDAALVVEVNRTGKLTCDNFSTGNFALFVSGTSETKSQAVATVTDEVVVAHAGKFYQLGATNDSPAGVRNITGLVIKDSTGVTPYEAGVDYGFDLALGRIQILDGAILDGESLKISYAVPAATWQRVKSGATAEITGAMRIVADNASGGNRDWYMPKVTLTPSGELPVIAEGTDFVQMEFGVEILKSANQEALYVDGRPAT